jgi:Ca-activated chloride channel family protein
MIEWEHPWLLLSALAVVPWLWWWLRKPRRALPYPDLRVLDGLPAGRARRSRWSGALLRAGLVLSLIVAVAGPRWPDVHTRIPTEGIAVELLLDVSGSMAEPDFDWDGRPVTRLEAAKGVLRLFVAGGETPEGTRLEGRSQDLVGLVSFAAWPESVCPLTLSHGVLLRLLDGGSANVKPRTLPTESRTNIGDAIAWGLHRLRSAPTVRKVIVLLSDGEHNVPPPALTPRRAAQLAANLKVPVYTIDVAGEADGDEEPRPDADAASNRAAGVATLQAIAQASGGRSFRARDTAGLLAACREIDRLERRKVESFVYRRYYEAYPWAGLAALACWGSVFFLERTVWRRVP